MTHTEELAERLARPKKKWECGLCPSCRRREACPGGSNGSTCANYLSPEPTKEDWRRIYREAYKNATVPCPTYESIMRIGRLNALRDAMMNMHGFSRKELEGLENDCRQDG